jgi:hypothetical protein
MDTLSHLIGSLVALALTAAAFVWLFNPRRGFEMLKKLGMTLVALILGIALFRHLAPVLTKEIDLSGLLVLLILSPLAYIIRESRLAKTRKQARETRGTERTPVMPNHDMEDDE